MAELTKENMDVVAQHMFGYDYDQVGCVFKKYDVRMSVQAQTQEEIDALKDRGNRK